jgi:hypothetical protein
MNSLSRLSDRDRVRQQAQFDPLFLPHGRLRADPTARLSDSLIRMLSALTIIAAATI